MAFRRGIVAIVAVFVNVTQMCLSEINRQSFPKGFVFGTAASAFQYEGAVKEDGRGPSVWDTFSHLPGKILDGSNGDVAVDEYHRYEEDVQLMKDMGMDAYRFSISWSRKDFATYAEICFENFGDRVKHWITFNEPHTFAMMGYDLGFEAPGRCSILLHQLCRNGNSATEPYIVAHNVLNSHAVVVDTYRKKFLDPLIFGDYPTSMRSRVGKRLPKFSKSQAGLLKGSLDFVGINHYTTFYAMHNTSNILGVLLNDSIADSGAFTFRMDDPNDPSISIKEALKDEKRIKYHNDYLTNLLASIIEDGCNVKGYFAWSLLDNWEWQSGFTSRFGLYFIDYKDNLKRYPKHSVEWFKKFLKST
ncbi:hypothetical protein Fmac_003172 [Flemingia macrophylla]|uniref:Beta-glucosidase n=1 Tax=Flemingia macrophylla TaxID=520843 RepID=A0ABD1NNG1_9FABA